MTESEALESALKKIIAQEKSNWGYIENFDVDENWAVRTAIEQVQQYRAIGTPEECRAAVEKQTAKKVTSFDYHNGTVNYGCPVCKRKIISKIDGKWCGGTFNEYCDRCGQKLDWSDEE